jgi:tRNA (cytidine/uridine-2'-O-)-methyltransferase
LEFPKSLFLLLKIGFMKVILFQPQIPQNTGNIVRTCSVTNTELVLVTPLGFSIQDRWLKRAGLDYWEGVRLEVVDDLETYLLQNVESFYCFSSKASALYTSVSYGSNTALIFGSETAGLPDFLWKRWPERFVKIPMKGESRCLNLATSVGIGVYEGVRQLQMVET